MRTVLFLLCGSAAALAAEPPPAEPRVPETVRFGIDVQAVLTKAGCNQGLCYGNLNGKGGFKLSLRGEDDAFDHASLNRDLFARRVNPHDADSSLILAKAVGTLPHQGGVRFEVGSWEYRTLRAWIAAGAKADPPGVPALAELEVAPAAETLTVPALSRQLAVRATFTDGATRDVTGIANYDVSDMAFEVTPGGLVKARRPGEVTVIVRYLGRVATARFTFLPDRPGFVWRPVPENNAIDRAVFAKLRALRMQPSGLCDDRNFLRRATLDLLGRVPTPGEVRAFAADTAPDKRTRLIDALLERPEYVDFWTLKWADVLRSDPLMLDPKGSARFHRFLRRSVAADNPMDVFVRELLSGSGSTYHEPAAGYYRIHRTPEDLAENTAQLWLGVRLKCARCHNHPAERWTQTDFYGLAAFFGRVGRKNHASRNAQDNVSAVQGEEIIVVGSEGEITHPKTGAVLAPRMPGDPARGFAPKVWSGPEPADRRTVLAEWLTAADNPFFDRAVANRVWGHLLGRGVVEPVDDFRDSNPPSNAALLEAITAEFVRNGRRVRPLIRAIMTSRVYQLSSTPDETNADDEANFARARPRRLTAEQLVDAWCDITGVPESYDNHPAGTRAVQLTAGNVKNPTLREFGKPTRLTVCECERTGEGTLLSAFKSISGPLNAKITRPDNRLRTLLGPGRSDDEVLTELYLHALSRPPADEERAAFAEHLRRVGDRRRAFEDVLWALLNSKEFQFWW
jgi:hypothetical protein